MSSAEETLAHATRVAGMLDEFLGLLFATRTTAAFWNVLGHRHSVAWAHAWMMCQGTLLMTMRRFDDLWRHHVTTLLDPTDPGFAAGSWLSAEIEGRKLRTTASKLFAHYAAEKSDAPLSYEEAEALMQSTGWATVREVRAWAGEAMWKIESVWSGLQAKYALPDPAPKDWMVAALDDARWMVDTIARRYGLPEFQPTAPAGEGETLASPGGATL